MKPRMVFNAVLAGLCTFFISSAYANAAFDELTSPIENAFNRRLHFHFTKAGRNEEIRKNIAVGIQESRDKFQYTAMERLYAADRQGACSVRRKAFEAQHPLALKLAMLSRDVYNGAGDGMAHAGVKLREISANHHAYQDNNGNFYAEEVDDVKQHQAIIVFRGTRKNSLNDMRADIGRFLGQGTPYYQWAQDITSQIIASHGGWDIITTGHSLGGGLALGAAAHFRNVRSIVFNPAGMPFGEWKRLSHDTQQRLIATAVAYVAVTPTAMDNVSAMSVVGLSVIPATMYALPVGAKATAIELHSIGSMVNALRNPSGNACDYDVGALGIRPGVN